jgi:hypothetical protein
VMDFTAFKAAIKDWKNVLGRMWLRYMWKGQKNNHLKNCKKVKKKKREVGKREMSNWGGKYDQKTCSIQKYKTSHFVQLI